MKKIKITSYRALSLIFTFLSISGYVCAAPSLLMGTIQFSKKSTPLPIHIDCGGTQISTTLHETPTPKITFEIPKGTTQTHFEVLVTLADIDGQLKQFPDQEEIQQTFDYLKIDPQSSYKYYICDLIDDVWEIVEKRLPATGQLPDRVILIKCYPEWVSDFKGGSVVELPTLFINNVADAHGESEEELQEALIKLELAVLDSNILNAPARRQIQTIADKKRILIMDLLT